jgi:quercetin dioxygenase-like cupin family protein
MPWFSKVSLTPHLTNHYTTLLQGDGFEYKQRTMAEGEVIDFETHKDQHQLVYIVFGKLKVTLGSLGNEETKELCQGEVFCVKNNTRHRIICTESALLTSTYIKVFI